MNGDRQFRFRLDLRSGVPVYRQLIDQVLAAIATATLREGDQLPTVRQVAVDLAINPNTVVRAYKELEIRRVLTTQQGTGTFISAQQPVQNEVERRRRLNQFVQDVVARAGAEGFKLDEVVELLTELSAERAQPKPGVRS
jgi:GntR family transcriptional regulator